MADWFENSPQTSRTVGALVNRTFRMYRLHFTKLMLLSLCVYVPYLIAESIWNAGAQNPFMNLVGKDASAAAISEQVMAHLPELAFTLVFAVISSLLVVPLLYGSILRVEVEYSVRERTPSPWQGLSHAWKKLGTVIGTEVLRWILYIVAFAVSSGVIVAITLLFQTIGLDSAAVTVAAVILSLTAAWILIWLAIRLMFTQSVVLEEDLSFMSAIRGSFALSRGSAWRIFGFMVVIQLIVLVFSLGVGAVTSSIASAMFQTVVTDVVSFFLTPFEFLAIAVLYIELRR